MDCPSFRTDLEHKLGGCDYSGSNLSQLQLHIREKHLWVTTRLSARLRSAGCHVVGAEVDNKHFPGAKQVAEDMATAP